MQTVLNVRMDSVLKERGDKILSENGISVSAAVRSLWEELAKTREVPAFIKDSSDAEMRKGKRKTAMEKLCSIHKSKNSSIDFSSLDDNALRDMQYDGKWKEYEALR